MQNGQEVLIRCDVENPVFVAMVTEECYKRGASYVKVEFSYTPIQKLAYEYRSLEGLSEVNAMDLEVQKWQAEKLPCRIWLDSDDPDGLSGVDTEKMAKANMARTKIFKPYRDIMENRNQWTIAGVPSAAWAKKVFPDVPESEAVEKLWEAIIKCSRCEGDPIAEWETHNKNLKKRCDFINSYGFEFLEYESSNGTSLKVGLNPKAQFLGGEEKTLQGTYFNPNIPSEELFTSPLKGSAEGVVYATKPLSYQGKIIENFGFEFKGGRVVKVLADKNRDVLEHMIKMDEGAPYMGEVALIGYDSPINNTGILFYNTLFDENASCHIALGMGYTNTLKDFEKYTKEEQNAMGVNDSVIHVDFMMGSRDMNIFGITAAGEKVQIFRDGDFVI